MPELNSFEQLRRRCRVILQDFTDDKLDGVRWDNEELNEYLDEGQCEFVKAAHNLVSDYPLVIRNNIEVYTLPSDVIEVIRIEDKNSRLITPSTWKYLQEEFGTEFRTATGDDQPSYWYADMDAGRGVRFYPRPNPTFETAPTEPGANRLQPTNITAYEDGGTWVAFGNLYVLSAPPANARAIPDTYVRVYGKSLELIEEISLDADVDFIEDPDEMRVHVTEGNVNTYNPTGTIWVSGVTATADKALCRYRPGIDSAFKKLDGSPGVTNQTIENFLPSDPVTPKYVFYAGGGKTFKHEVDAHATHLTETEVMAREATSGILVQSLTADPLVYAACGTDGVWKWEAKTGGAAEEVTGEDVYAIVKLADDTIYVIHGVEGSISYLATMTTAGVITDTTIQVRNTSHLFSDGQKIWVEQLTGSNAFITEVEDGVVTRVWDGEVCNFFSTQTSMGQGFNGHFIGKHTTRQTSFLHTTNREQGVVVRVNDETFNQEHGALVDHRDTDNVISFKTNIGVVVQVVDEVSAAQIYYLRKPRSGIVEVEDAIAVVYYAVARAYEKDDDEQNFAKSQYWFAKYRQQVAQHQGRAVRGFSPTAHVTKSYFY